VCISISHPRVRFYLPFGLLTQSPSAELSARAVVPAYFRRERTSVGTAFGRSKSDDVLVSKMTYEPSFSVIDILRDYSADLLMTSSDEDQLRC